MDVVAQALRLKTVAALAALACAASACANGRAGGAAGAPASAGLRLDRVAAGLEAPLYLTAPPGDRRLFIVEQPGRIRIVKDGRLVARPYLDLTDRVGYGGERGLLSVAFHPRFRENGQLFVDYTNRHGDTRVTRFTTDPAADTVPRRSEQLVLGVDQPYANHNGGHILFGPDGFLWVAMGDGGSAGDPHGNGQNTRSLLGKLLRLDVDRSPPYAIPAGNPFADGTGGAREVWAYGLRNPWRIAFDRATGLLYIADVGQNRWEEIDVVRADTPGVNYGWRRLEGTHCYGLTLVCTSAGTMPPVLQYGHDEGCSVIGGPVYRGRSVPALAGHYLYSDYCSGWLRSFRYEAGRAADRRTWDVPNLGPVLSFGEDAEGEVYVLTGRGDVYRIAADTTRH